MTEIIQSIDDFTANFLSGYTGLNSKLWGFCELAHRTSPPNGKDQPTVMSINGTSDRKYVTLDDRYDFISWIRIPGVLNFSDNDQWNFGFKEARFQTINFRWVIAHKVQLGENLIYSLVNQLPESLSVSGYQVLFVNPVGSVDHDHETIYRTELGDTVYEKHRFPWNLYVINLSIEFLLCEGFVISPCSEFSGPITVDMTQITIDNG